MADTHGETHNETQGARRGTFEIKGPSLPDYPRQPFATERRMVMDLVKGKQADPNML